MRPARPGHVAGNSITPAVESLVTATIVRLRRHPPFDGMENDTLRFVAERISLSHHPRGSTIFSPEHGEPQALFIVQRGLVHLAPAGAETEWRGTETTLGEGVCFSVDALVEQRPPEPCYTALGDT